MATPTLAEKLDKIRSPGLQSQQRSVVVLHSIDATLKDQNAAPTPTGYFAALLALLQQACQDDTVNAERAIPAVYLLDVITPFAPQPLLRSKFTTIFGLLAPVLLLPDAEAILIRTSIGCLESLLIAQDTPSWEQSVAQIAPRRAVAGLLNLGLDPRPKVRKRALEAVKKVLRNPPPSPSLDHPAAEMCAQTAAKNLEDLAKERKGKKADANDPPLLHALQLAKSVAVASGGWPSKNIESLCELLLGIAKSGNEYMTMAIFDIFEVIFEGMTDEISSAKLPRLMEIISELRPAANDTQLCPPWLAIISRGYDVSAQVDADETFQKLPDLFNLIAQFLESSSENIRISASECLVSFMANCVPQQVILDPSIYDEKVLEKLAKSAESLLSVQYQAAWLQTFNVLGAMFDVLRWRANPILLNITKTLGEIRENSAFRNKQEADQILGKAIRAMGPDTVLSVLPLNIAKPTKGQPGRAWMFPILRDFISNAHLEHFKTEMLPLIDLLVKKVAEHGAAEKTMEVKIYETLVQQVWSTLPGYCDLPLDLSEAFSQSFAETLANVLYEHVDLRLDVCRALKTLIESNRVIADIPEDEDEDLILQSRISRQTAKANLTFLGSLAGNMLLVLLNVYTQTLPQSRGPILQTINAFLSITPEAEIIETFDRISTMLAGELQPSETTEKPQKKEKDMPSTAQTLMDLVITMSVYLPRTSFSTLFNIASIVIVKQDEPQLQKKAYKLIPRLVESDTGKEALQGRSAELQTLIISATEKISAPARRDRLVAISALLHFIPDTSLHFIPSVLSEVVICCKENNERAREAAYDLLVQMGHRMIAANGATINNAQVPHMPEDAAPGKANIEEYLTMVSAGLAGSTPHMISASITALSRLLYEFRAELSEQTVSDLVQTMDLFLTSNNREIVKSCLGFVKVCVISLPVELMTARLSTLVPNLIVWSNEHKGHFKAKVKHIIERMVRRFGYDNIYKHTPDSDKKLLVNIRKTKERAKKQKEAAKKGGNADEDDDDEAKRTYENEYDQALYSSDSDSEDSDDDEPSAPKGKKSKGANQYILEDESEPLDLLDKTALAKISSTRPLKARKPSKSKVRLDLDGKLILDGKDADAMDVDDEAGGVNEEDTGVGAYVAALKGKDVAKRGRGGKIKFSNRRSKDDDEEMEMGEEDAKAVKARISPGKPFRGRGGSGGRGGGGRGGGGRGGGGFRGGRGGGGGQSGKGGIAAGRRGLGVDKRKGQSVGIGKGRGRGRN